MNEQLLWNQFISGDRVAFDRILHQYYLEVYYYGMKFSKDPETVKDAIQDLFLGLWDRREHLVSVLNIRAYLFASLRRILHRKQQKSDRLPTVLTDRESFMANHFYFSLDEHYIQNEAMVETAQWLNQRLASLPKRQLEVVYLRYFKQFSRNEVAEVMGISPQTVANLQQAALRKLRDEAKDTRFAPLLVSLFLALAVS
jgi:RNA polymerase sigma factor (sigma-70 family)